MNTQQYNIRLFVLSGLSLFFALPTALCNNPATSNEDICSDVIELSIKHDDNAEEISWTLVNIDQSIKVADGEYFTQEDDFQTVETAVCLPSGCYELTVYDSWGDGICNGSNDDQTINITSQSGISLITSNGKFEDFISVEFCVDENGTSISQPRT